MQCWHNVRPSPPASQPHNNLNLCKENTGRASPTWPFKFISPKRNRYISRMSPPSTPWPFEVDFRPSGSLCTCTVTMATDLLLASDSFQNALLLPTWNRRRLFNSTPARLLLGSIQTMIHSTQYNRQSATQIKPLTSAWSSSLGCMVVGLCASKSSTTTAFWGQQLPVTLAGSTMTIRRQSFAKHHTVHVYWRRRLCRSTVRIYFIYNISSGFD